MDIELEPALSDLRQGLASSVAALRACETLVHKYNLEAEFEELYEQYLLERIKKIQNGLH